MWLHVYLNKRSSLYKRLSDKDDILNVDSLEIVKRYFSLQFIQVIINEAMAESVVVIVCPQVIHSKRSNPSLNIT